MQDNFETFFKAHEARIYYQMRRLGILHEAYDDYYAEGILALWHGYQHHDKAQGEFGTYLNYQIRYRLLDLLRKQSRERELSERGENEEKVRLDAGNRHRGTQASLPIVADLVVENTAFWDEVKSHLTPNQWKWVHYFIIAELTVQEIVEIEDVSAEAVKSWARQARKKLRHDTIRLKLEALL